MEWKLFYCKVPSVMRQKDIIICFHSSLLNIYEFYERQNILFKEVAMKKNFISITFTFGVLILFILPVNFAAYGEGEKEKEEDYPTKSIKLVCPYGPGGATDLAARALTSVIPEYLGQAVVVVNKPGSSGALAFDFVRKSEPNGYTMMMAAIGSNALVPAINPTLKFDYDDLSFIARTQINPNVLVVKSESKFKSLDDLINALKNNPGEYHYATAAVGGVQHIGPILLLQSIGLPVDAAKPVHYNSDSEAILAVIQGEADFYQGNLSAAAGNLKGGLVRGLAMTTPERVPGFENIPTYTELGYPEIDIVGWRGVCGPPGLPEDIIKVWENAVKKTCESKSWLKLITKLGDRPGYLGSHEFANFVDKDFKRYRELCTELGILVK